MTRSTEPRKLTLRRLATFLAAIGMLLASSGVALMVAAAPANAATKVGICHATESDSNPYSFISVDDDSARFAGHLAHRQTPNKKWKTAGTFNGVLHAADEPKPDLISDYTDDQGVFHKYDGVIVEADCNATNVVLEATADVDFFDATCAAPTRAEYETSGSNVSFSVLSGSATPGSAIVVRATATNGATFDGGATTRDFPHTFDEALDPNGPPCVVVNPPVVKVNVCHATGSDTNPYEYIFVDNDAVKLQGHLDHRQNPQQTWKDAGVFNGVPHAAGDPKPDLIGDFVDDQGDLQVYDGVITEALCNGAVTPVVATADVVFVDPSCANPTTASYTTSGTNVTFSVTSGSATPGSAIEVTATAIPGAQFTGGNPTTRVFDHVYPGAVDPNAPPCVIVNPPVADSTADVLFVDPSCVNLGLAVFLPFGNQVTFAITDGVMLPGQPIEITATANAGHTFADNSTTKVFTHVFGPAVNLNGPPCVIVNPPADADATAEVSFVDPTCDNANLATYTTSGNEVTFAITDGAVAPGSAVEVTATANAGHTFADLSTTQVFTHLFSPAADLNAEPCVTVEPPVVNPPIVTPPGSVPLVDPPFAVPTVVRSGLVSADDLRGEQGMALLGAGMAMMVLAGGLGLGSARRARS